MPGPPASRVSYALRGIAAVRHRANTDALSGHDFSRAATLAHLFRLQPLRSCFPGSLDSSRTPENPREMRKSAAAHPPFMFRLNRTPILCFQSLAPTFNRTMFRLKITTDEQKSKPKLPIPPRKKVLADMPSAPESPWPPRKEGFKLISESRSQKCRSH